MTQDYKQFVRNKRFQSYDVYVGRPSKYGNPFSHKKGTLAKYKVDTREEAIDRFREWFLSNAELVESAKRELKGKTLGCWCYPAKCHAEILAEVANS